MAYNPYDLRRNTAVKQSQTRKETWEEQKPQIQKQVQQEAQRKRVLDILAQNMNTGAPSAEDQREMRLTAAKGLEEQARQQYEAYVRSSEGRKEAQEAQQLQNQLAFASGGSITFPIGVPAQGEKAKEYEAAANYYEQNRKAVQDMNTMEKDVEEVARMSDEDRRLLETYAYGRNEWFDHKAIGDSVAARAELEKKYGKQKVEELAESWQRYQNAVSAEKNIQQTQEGAGSGFWAGAGHSAASVAANALGSLTAPLGYLQEAFGRTGRYQTLDPNNPGAMPGQYASAVRQEVAGNIEETALGKAGAVAYQGTMGAMDNLARIAMSGGTKFGSLGLAALGSFGSTLSEASAQGATPGQAVGKAVLSAGIEVATEKIGLDELFAAGKGGYKGAMAAFRQALKQGGVEAAEEEISLLGNVLVDALVMREKSAYNQQIAELVANGMSYADAKAQADRALWDEAVNTAVTSWVSGSVMSGAQSGAQYVGRRIQERNATRNATASEMEAVGEDSATTEDAREPEVREGKRKLLPKLKRRRRSGGEAFDMDSEDMEEVYRVDLEALRQEREAAAENATTEKPKTITDEQIREAMNELYPREKTRQERLEELETEMDRMVNNRELLTEEGQSRYQALSQEWEALNGQEESENAGRADSLESEEAPPERAMPEYVGANERISGNPLAGRTEESVGSRSVKAYQYENPEVKPYFQDAARGILSDINSSMPGQRTFNEELHYQSGGEKGWSGNKRITTADLAEIKDTYGYTWDELREAAEDIIHDRGRENNAASKRLEFLIHDRLANGYTDVEGRPVPTNREYLDFLEERQINEYRREGVEDLLANAERYAPQGAGEGFEAMGAASKGFTGKEAYYELLTDDNVKPERSGAVRPMEIPETDANGRRVTDFASNAAAAAATSDAMADALAELIGDGSMGFDTRGHKESLENARAYIEKNSMAKTAKEISDRISKGMVQDGDVEKALLLYTLYGNQDNQEAQAQAVELLSVLGKMANISGRNLNLFGLLRKLTPEGQLQAVEDDIKRTIGDINKTRSGFKQITGEQMRIDEGLAEAFTEAETEEAKKEALDDIYKDVAARIKPTLGEAWDQWRNLAMLGNFKTHARNFLGSMAFRPYVAMKRTIGAALESVFVDQENRTKAVIGLGKESRALLKWAKKDAKSDSAKFMLNYSGTTGDTARSAIEENRKYLPGPLDKLRKGNMQLMESADMLWKRKEYALSLAGFLKARGYTAKQAAMDMMTPGSIPEGVMQEARAYATQEAMKATFNDRNKFSNLISRLRIKDNKPWSRAINVVTKGILPFARTPANVAVRAAEYSPAGLAEGFRQLAQDVKTGEATVSQGIDKIASGLTGAGAMVLGAALAAGLIPGIRLVGKIEDKDEEEPGAMEYSIQIGDTYYGISWLAPANIPLFVGANLYGNLSRRQGEGDMDGWDVLSALVETSSDALDPMLELSMLSSLNDVLQTAAYEESAGDKVLAILASSATNYFTQGIPTLFGQIEQATEEMKKSVYSNADNPLQRSFEKTVGRATQRLPGDLYQVERLDANGEPVRNHENWIARAADALVNPATISKSQETEVSAELRRLNQAQDENVSPPTIAKTLTYTDSDGKRHEDYRLSGEEYTALTAAQRGAENRIIADMLSNADYVNLPDEAKARAVAYAQSYARELARGEVLPGYDGMDSWMQGIEGKEAGAIIQKVAAAEMTDAFSAITTAWREGYADDSEAKESLESAFSVFDGLTPAMQEAIAQDAGGRLGYYLAAKKAGMETETFVELYRKYWEIDQGEKTTSQKAQEWAHYLEKAFEARTITNRQRDVLKDEMVYMQMFPAETEKFDQLTESGLSADDAQDIGWLIQGLEIQEGYSTVRPVQKAEAIAGSSLSEADKIAALKIYGSDAQDENLDLILEMGGTTDDYVKSWLIYAREDAAGGKGTKERTIQAFMEELGVNRATATAIYDIYG